MTKATMIEAMAALLAAHEQLTMDKITWLAGLQSQSYEIVAEAFNATFDAIQQGLYIGNSIRHAGDNFPQGTSQ